MELLARVTLSPASQYVKNHVDSILSCHIPVPLHWAGLVLDGDAPFGISKQQTSFYSCREGLAWQLQRAYYLDFARVVLTTFSLRGRIACMHLMRLRRVLVCIFPLFRVLSLPSLSLFVCPFGLFALFWSFCSALPGENTAVAVNTGVEWFIMRVDLGFNPQGVLVAQVVRTQLQRGASDSKCTFCIPLALLDNTGEAPGLHHVSLARTNVRLVTQISCAKEYAHAPSQIELGAELLRHAIHESLSTLGCATM